MEIYRWDLGGFYGGGNDGKKALNFQRNWKEKTRFANYPHLEGKLHDESLFQKNKEKGPTIRPAWDLL